MTVSITFLPGTLRSGTRQSSGQFRSLATSATLGNSLTPKKQGDQHQEDVEQVGLDVPLLKHAEPREHPRPQAKRGQHRFLEHGVGHLAMEIGMFDLVGANLGWLRKQR